MQNKSAGKLTVTHYQRKRLPSGQFSVEFIFDDVRTRLSSKVIFKVKIASRDSTGIYNRIINTIEAIFHQSDVNHVTGDIHYITLFLRRKNTILTILDCVFLQQKSKIKRFIYRIIWLTLPARRVRYITAISQSTKDDILRNVRVDADKVIVIPVAVASRFVPYPKQFNAEYPTLLQVGTAPNKNLSRLIEALEGIPCKLVIVGRMNTEISGLLEKHHIDYENKWNLADEEMLQEYIRCDILTFVSTYEGFGMPIIEANCVERPVIAGNNTSMVEVAGTAACLVNAWSVEEIRQGILRIIEDKDYREQLVRNGKSNKLRFDPQKIAESYHRLYSSIHSD